MELVPGNLNALITMATVIPNGVDGRSDREDLLAKAHHYANAVVATLETLTIPEEIPLEQWEARSAELRAEANEALGHVALKNGSLAEAVRRFEAAVEGNPRPKASQWYRLGGTYLMAGQQEKAIAPLRRAAESGDDTVRRLALDQLRRIEAGKSR